MNKILVIWDVMLDKYTYWEVKRLNPEWPNPLLNVISEEVRLWWSANVSANIASLNWTCDLIWIVWNDKNAEIFTQKCKEKNINFFWQYFDVKTTTKQRFIENTYKQQLLRVDYEDYFNLPDKSVENILEIIKSKVYEIIVISDYNKWIITEKLISEIKKLWIKILVDTKPKNLKLFSDVFLVKPNFKEFSEIIWKDIENDDKEIKKHWINLVKKLNTNLIVTRWSKWASLITKDLKCLHIKTDAKEVFDVTWAWDTFIATVAYFLSIWKDLETSIKFWNKASGIVIWKVWTEIINKNELIK